MTELTDFASDSWSQFGEDGCIAHIFDRIGVRSRIAVEFGAGDGESCSNTARLWREQGWKGFLVEPEPARFEALEANARLFDTVCRRAFVEPVGPNSISVMLAEHGIGESTGVDLMSIDVDGDDFFILRELTIRPRVIVIEFNPTVPPHIELRQKEPGGTFGASLLAIIRVGGPLGYEFVGATRCNAFLVDRDEAGPFQDYVTNPEILFPPEQFTYAVTDFAGRMVLCGQVLPWDAKEPYVLPLESSTYVRPPTDSVQQIRRGFEALWGPAVWLSPDGLSTHKFRQHLLQRPALVCIDLSAHVVDEKKWLWEEAGAAGYQQLFVGRVLGLIRET